MNKLYNIIGRITLILIGMYLGYLLITNSILYIIKIEDNKPLPAGQVEIQFKIDEMNRYNERQKELDRYNEMTKEEKIKYEMEKE